MPAEQKWLAKLLGYAFVVEYKRGLRIRWQMHFPGNLTLLLWTHSCPYNKKTSCLLLFSIPDPTWLAVLKDSYSQDPSVQQLISSIQSGAPPKGFTF